MKPLLVGEANPYQSDPRLAQRFALYPDPPRCAGWNLCHRVMGLTEREYLTRFDRVNLCAGKWSMREAREHAARLAFLRPPSTPVAGEVHGRKFLLLGAKVCKAFEVSFTPFITLGRFTILPHPSGLSRAWNEPGAYERARSVLREAGVL